MAGIWRHVKLILGTSGLFLAILNLVWSAYIHGTGSLTNTQYWILVQLALQHSIVTASLLVVAIGFLILCWRASEAVTWDAELDKYRQRYVIQRVRTLDPKVYLSPYLPNVCYRARPQDAELRQRLVGLQRRRSNGVEGVYVIGIPMAGKTRMAWEAMRTTLGDHLFIKWPRDSEGQLPAHLLRNQRIVVWLDNLHEYTNPVVASLVEDIPRMFQYTHAIIIATCWTEDLWTASDARVLALLTRLKPTKPQDISEEEALQLYADFSREEPTNAPSADFKERWDRRTPGSLIVGNESMRRRFLSLPENPQRVFWVMQLLDQAGFGTSLREERVRQASTCLFSWPRNDDADWQKAIGILIIQGYLSEALYQESSILKPAADSYLKPDLCVIPPPNWREDWASAWRELPQAFETSADFQALAMLGFALLDSHGDTEATPEPLNESLLSAEKCFKAILEKYRGDLHESLEAVVWANLGLTLIQLAELTAIPDNIQQAIGYALESEQASMEAWRQLSNLASAASPRNPHQWAAERDSAEVTRNRARALRARLESMSGM